MIEKWRVDSNQMKHYDLLKVILDESGYSLELKNKKDLENENRLENIKELIRAMQDYENLQTELIEFKKSELEMLKSKSYFFFCLCWYIIYL